MNEDDLDVLDDFVDEETEFDLLFPVIPIEDDPYPPDETQLVDDLADFAQDEQPSLDTIEADEALADDFAFDWDVSEFHVGPNGGPLRVSGEDAVVEWALKALNTPRGVYPLYPPDYGSEFDEILGRGLPTAVERAELMRSIEECLLRHPLIVEVLVDDVKRLPELGANSLLLGITLLLATSDEPVTLELTA